MKYKILLLCIAALVFAGVFFGQGQSRATIWFNPADGTFHGHANTTDSTLGSGSSTITGGICTNQAATAIDTSGGIVF